MIQTAMQVTVSCGYRFVEKNETTTIMPAVELLRSRRAMQYTQASRSGETVTFTRHIYLCPHCGRETPAYAPFLVEGAKSPRLYSAEVLCEWAAALSFFPDDHPCLYLQPPLERIDVLVCPHCGGKSTASAERVTLQLWMEGERLIIRRAIPDLPALMALPWLKEVTFLPVFPLYEQAVVDMAAVSLAVELVAANGERMQTKSCQLPADISPLWQEWFDESQLVQRAVKRLLQTVWSTPLPYKAEEIDFSRLMLLCRFREYPRTFYEHLPLDSKTLLLEDTFVPAASLLRTPDRALEQFAAGRLPQTKSIRRHFVTQPVSFLFLKEAEILYDLLPDINLFRQVLTGPDGLFFLSLLREYPGVLPFYRDYATVMGPHTLCQLLVYHLRRTLKSAAQYSLASPAQQAANHPIWKKRKFDLFYTLDWDIPLFSKVYKSAPAPAFHMQCNRLMGYGFAWLQTPADYKRVGLALQNCLTDWSGERHPVVAVYRGRHPVAAIEIDGDKILHAFKARNKRIPSGSQLHSAIRQWAERHQLVHLLDEEDDL